mmetsp:Transcript_9526/g.14304  ORF Transcript_9526/g.14304 Transcript_9526/m.14304 type:complete len:531 (-) Transcript_9526:235-1827(-)
MGFSVVEHLDGSMNCDAESAMGYGGLPLWIALIVYLMLGLYLVCEHHFVPSLKIFGDRMRLPDDAQGATIMAAGSSAPEFFTALIGVLFYSNENPGPGTIVGSAVFNVCVIIGLSAILAPRPLPLNKFSLYRDSIAYLLSSLALITFYEGITPGRIDIWESLIMVLMYVSYTIIVARRSWTISILTRACCGCRYLQQQIQFSALQQDEDESMVESKFGDVELSSLPGGRERFDSKGIPEEEILETQHQASKTEADLKLEEGKADIIDQAGIEARISEERVSADSGGLGLDAPLTTLTFPVEDEDAPQGRTAELPGHRRRRSILEFKAFNTFGGLCERIYRVLKAPMEFIFKYTIPNPQYFSSFEYCFVFTFSLAVLWLAVLTFLVVDLAEKIGTCLGMSEVLLGLTVLAIGSSLPDCISSVLIALECKGDMAVCNALGSNTFDILLCLGFTFFIQSCIQGGASIPVESGPGFESLMISMFLIQACVNGLLIFSGHTLQKWHGYTLLTGYCLFVVYSFVDYEVIVPEQNNM